MFEGVCHNCRHNVHRGMCRVANSLCWIICLNRGTVAAAVSVDYAGFAEPGSAVIMLSSFSW